MATRHKRTKISKEVSRKPEGIADLLSKLEVEAERVVRRFVEKAEHSSRELKKGVSTLVDQIRSEGFVSTASEKTDDLRKIAEEVISRAKEIQFLQLGSFNRDEIVREAKKNLGDVVTLLNGHLNSSEFFARAKATALNKKDQFLSILSIPNASEITKLSRKIATLENRVSHLTRKAA